MIRLSVGVGYSMFKTCFDNPFSDTSSFFSRLKQHRMILSPSIIEYYLSCVPDGYRDYFITWLDDVGGNDETSINFSESDTIDVKQFIIDCVKQVEMRTLVSEESEFEGYSLRKVNLVTPKSIAEHENNAFNKFTFPITNHIVPEGANCEPYSKWFGHLFEDEKTITIIDAHLFSKDNLESLKKFYLSQIEEDTEINIYSSFKSGEFNGATTEQDLSLMVKEAFNKWNVNVYMAPSVHDRYILLSGVQISIGYGLGFLHPSGFTRKSCAINVTNDRIISIPENARFICSSR